MDQRNWLQLSRKLVDQYDLEFTLDSIQETLGQYALSFWGEGVLVTTTYPNPFPITMSGSVLGGSVGTGIAFDPNGMICEIDSSPDESTAFTLAAADATNSRWDLLCIEYQQVGDTPVPKPSDPITTIDLNLHDDFELVVVTGTPSPTPSYPAKPTDSVILAGLRVPANATLGSQVSVDLSIRETAQQAVFQNPSVLSETPAGAIPGNTFTLSKAPINGTSLLVFVDGILVPDSAWSLTGVTLTTTVAAAQSIDVWYIWNNPSSINPITAGQEVPVNTGDNLTFNLGGNPVSKNALLVWVDGLLLPASQYSLVIGATSQIVLTSALEAGQDIYAVYFQLVSQAGGGGGGSVSGAENLDGGFGLYAGVSSGILQFKALVEGSGITIEEFSDHLVITSTGGSSGPEAHGDFAAPVNLNPTVGLVPSSAGDQAWWISPATGSGAVPITSALQIAAGSVVGQRLTVFGVTNGTGGFFTLVDGSGIMSNGDFNMISGQGIVYFWNGSLWQFLSNAI